MNGLRGVMHGRRWTVITLGLLVLMTLTLALDHAPWRYQVVVDSVLDNLDFSQGSKGWAASGRNIRIYPGTPSVLALSADGIGQNVLVGRRITRPSQGHERIRISADLSSHGLIAGTASWQRGRLILLSLNKRGKRIWYWPQEVAAIDGTTPWQHYQGEIPLNPEAAQTWLIAYVSASAGKLLIKNLAVQAVTETPVYQLSRALVIGLWIIAGIGILFALLPTVRRHPAALTGLLYGMALLAGGLTPQPQLNDTIDNGRQILAQLVAAGARLFPEQVQQRTHPSIPSEPSRGMTGHEASTAEPAKKSTPTARSSIQRSANQASLTAHLRSAGSDKRIHLAAFVGLSLLLLLTLRSVPRYQCILSALLLGAIIETLQSLLITREPEWGDIGYDSVGVIVGAIIALSLLKSGFAKYLGSAVKGIYPPTR